MWGGGRNRVKGVYILAEAPKEQHDLCCLIPECMTRSKIKDTVLNLCYAL